MSISAMKQALEALEEYQAKGAPFWSCDSAAAALRQAIAEAEKQEPVYVESSRFPRGPLDHKPGTVIAKPVPAIDISQECVDETAKRKHEPVAWRCPIKRKDCTENCGSYGCWN